MLHAGRLPPMDLRLTRSGPGALRAPCRDAVSARHVAPDAPAGREKRNSCGPLECGRIRLSSQPSYAAWVIPRPRLEAPSPAGARACSAVQPERNGRHATWVSCGVHRQEAIRREPASWLSRWGVCPHRWRSISAVPVLSGRVCAATMSVASWTAPGSARGGPGERVQGLVRCPGRAAGVGWGLRRRVEEADLHRAVAPAALQPAGSGM